VFGYRIAVSSFTVTGHEAPHAVEQVIVDSFVAKLTQLPGVEVLDRRNLEHILEEQKLALSGLVDSNTIIETGKVLGSMAIITGSCVFLGDDCFFSSKLIDNTTGKVIHALSTPLAGSFFQQVDVKVGEMVRGLSVDENDEITGKSAALWFTSSGAEESAQEPVSILIYAMSNVDDSVDDWGQWYLGPSQLLPVTQALREKDYAVQVHDRRTLSRLTDIDLSEFTQVWLMEGDSNSIVDPTPAEVNALYNYFLNGGGVWLSGENFPDPVSNNWTEDINAFARPFGYQTVRNVVSYSTLQTVPPTRHPLGRNVKTVTFDVEVGLIEVTNPRIEVVIPLEPEARLLPHDMRYEELFLMSDPERYAEVYNSGGSYSFGWLLNENFEKVGPKVPRGSPGVIAWDARDKNQGRLVGDSGWALGWTFTDYQWEEYKNADNLTFLLNAAAWLAGE
jgi:hypothetical protein